jgi:UDP-2-acetamido-2,6-beta-L-arabino-hexul-4-ose reductase
MILIGNGMLAKAFMQAHAGSDDLLLFCSGVSNSGTTSTGDFEREKLLLLDSLRRYPHLKCIYFSSCAASPTHNFYYRHKQAMQDLVQASAQRYLIVRLPQVVGLTKNATLVRFIAHSIKTRTPITVFKGARRNLIDVDDVVRLTLHLAGLGNMVINVTNANMVPVEEIISMVSCILGAETAICSGPSIAEGPDYDGHALKTLIGVDDPIYASGYNMATLTKYVPMLCI